MDLALEKGELERVFQDMQWLQQMIKGSRDFTNLLRSPVIKADKKDKIVDTILQGRVTNITSLFIRLLIAKGRESNLPEMITSFISQYKAHKNIYPIKLTTAAPISENLKEGIMDQIRKTSEMKNIELEAVVDENLIGGFVLEAGDKLIDASIAYDLKQIARQFENNDFVYKIR